MSKISKKTYIIAFILLIVVAILFYFILPISVPLILALFTALLLEPVVAFLQTKVKLNRQFSIIIVFAIFTLVLALTIFFISTKVVAEGIKFIEDAPGYINNITTIWHEYEENLRHAAQDFPDEVVKAFTEEINNAFETLIIGLKQYVNIEKISAFLSYIPNYLVSFIVYLIALFLFMIDLPRLKTGIYKYMTDKTAEKFKFMTTRLSSVIIGFFKAQFLVSLIIFAATLLGLLIIQPKIALMMAIIIWIIDLIPIIGSIIVMAPWALYHLLVGDTVLGTKLAILGVVLLVIRRTVEPKVMGQHLGLSPLATLISMYLGLKLFGIWGFIIGPASLIIFKSAKEAGIIKLNYKI
ncbi:sporulation integral membrane protein YtvI [Bacillus sp. J14TS2]|uniref:sporulation integral membrane protein YtvI n=1 Tax=Bacillus sp. J14TS2 TaxID=2807188 RepID=UPI001B1E22BD|nr:sporulation integral membrane protein YtvI [Bacillus sp. J14TS2]GIN74405.1 sporulation integral membrane protein YtvI [Bacillus sp. J14TS2]